MKNKISKFLEKITTGLMYAFPASTIAFFCILSLDLFGAFSHLSDAQVQTLGFTLIGTVLGSLFGYLTIGAAANALDNSIHKDEAKKRGKELADSFSREQLMLKYENCMQRYNLLAERLDNIPILSLVARKEKEGVIFYDEETFENYGCHKMEALEEQLSAYQDSISENVVAAPVMAFRRNGACEALQDSALKEFWNTKKEVEYLEYALVIQSATLSPAPRITVTSNASNDTTELQAITDDSAESTGLLMQTQ